MGKEKILTINKMFKPEIGGVEIVAENIAKIAKSYGYVSEVLTFNKDKYLIEESIDNIKITRIPTLFRKDSIRWSFKYRRILKSKLENCRIILFHFPSFQPEIDFLVRNKYKKIKKICFYHADIVGRRMFDGIYNALIVNKFLDSMDKIIVTSPNIKNSSNVLKGFHEKIEIIPLFVDLKHFYYRKDNKREFLLNKFKNKKEKIVMYIGRLGRYKGLDYLVKSYKYLDKKTGIVIIGNGPKEKEIKKLVDDLNFSNDILFLNHVPYPDLPSYYSAADLFVLPSTDRGEAFGLVVIEAMACGIPVITTELGTGTSYHNIDGVTGRVIPPKNEEEIAKAIKEILFESPERYKKENIIKRAAEFSYENFEKNVVEKILS